MWAGASGRWVVGGFRIGILVQVLSQDAVQTSAGRGDACGLNAIEEVAHGGWGGDVLAIVLRGVEEVDVYAVGIVLGGDGGDIFEGSAELVPVLACHGSRVVDYEDCVKGFEEVILVLTH